MYFGHYSVPRCNIDSDERISLLKSAPSDLAVPSVFAVWSGKKTCFPRLPVQILINLPIRQLFIDKKLVVDASLLTEILLNSQVSRSMNLLPNFVDTGFPSTVFVKYGKHLSEMGSTSFVLFQKKGKYYGKHCELMLLVWISPFLIV